MVHIKNSLNICERPKYLHAVYQLSAGNGVREEGGRRSVKVRVAVGGGLWRGRQSVSKHLQHFCQISSIC